ncbi:MAG: imidazole glycerol phosphate synthase subunit HisH [Bacteroidetes bacterium]|nr:imidazole glycerol phosphate synthase subunit HisH [Bacteroidota bacterium]
MIALIDSGAGNVASVANVLKDLNAEYILTKREIDICNADKIIFPGVGEASFAVRQLHILNLFNLLRIVKKPMLGICLGMQLMCEKLVEGNSAGLGIFPVSTEIFSKDKVKVPHMGWNKVEIIENQKLFDGINNNEYYYYANSFYVPINEYTIAKSNHGSDFSASIKKDNYYGVQFHPEKSGAAGIKLLKNFIELC